MTEINGLAPKGYRPMWEGEIIPDSAIFKDGNNDSATWTALNEGHEEYINDVFCSDVYNQCAVPVDHVPVFDAVQVPKGEDDPVEIPEGFRRLGYDEKIPYYALWRDDSSGEFIQVDDDIVGNIVGDTFTSDTIAIARIIPDGYDALDFGEVIASDDLWIAAGNVPDEWERCGEYSSEVSYKVDDTSLDGEFIWIRKRETADDKIRKFMGESIALIEKYAPAFEEVGAASFAESAINDLREIVNASKG